MRRKRTFVLVVVLLLILLISPVWITYREYRQARLDHALIAAIKAEDDKKALEALAEGANGEARDTGEPPTFREALLHLWDRVRHPVPAEADGEHVSALVLYLQFPHRFMMRQGSGSSPVIAQVQRRLGPNVAVVKSLLDHGAKVDERTSQGMTPLWYASVVSKGDMIRLLLSRGADIEAKNAYGSTPLMQADAESAEILLEHGANIEARDGDNKTPLISQVIRGSSDVIRILLEHGAKVTPKDNSGRTALDYVRSGQYPGYPKIIALLKQYGAK